MSHQSYFQPSQGQREDSEVQFASGSHASDIAPQAAPVSPSATARSPFAFIAPLLGIVIALLCVALALLALSAQKGLGDAYSARIYPAITVGGFSVGGMTQEEAVTFLQQQYARKIAILSTPEKQIVAPWSSLGVSIDAAEAARRAYNVGRAGSISERLHAWWNTRELRPFLAYDAAVASQYLQAHVSDLCDPPRNAGVLIQDGIATPTPSVPGCEVDVQATLTDLYSDMIREQSIPVHARQVYPVVADSNPAVDQINEWLTRPFTLQLWFDNNLVTRLVAPRERMSWMQASVEPNGLSANMNADAIGKFLSEVALELGPNADLRTDEAAGLVRAAMLRGDQSVWLVVPRQQIRYTVEAGDTFDRLADRFGIPSPRLVAANPDVQPNDLMVNQQIVIPAQSSMLPVTIQPDNLKHIEVDLATQQLYAYDGAKVELTATISSGIPKWRTLNGVYQVENKSDEAYNTLAHVRMPNWMTIYALDDPGSVSNGIHALPILQSGKRLWSGYLGKPVSFGCIVMNVQDSDFLYHWADVGTPIVIHGITPSSALNYDNLVEAQKVNE